MYVDQWNGLLRSKSNVHLGWLRPSDDGHVFHPTRPCPPLDRVSVFPVDSRDDNDDAFDTANASVVSLHVDSTHTTSSYHDHDRTSYLPSSL